ncbi:MAG TPA: membrane protein insertase YidC [Dongiaceae bacterium]
METKNLIIAIALSAVILVVWTVFIQGPHVATQQAQQQAQQAAQQTQTAQQPAQTATQPESGRKIVSREEALKEGPRVAIDTPRLKGSIALKGSRIDDLVLKDYHDTVDPSSPNVILLSPLDTKDAYFANLYWSADGKDVGVPDGDTLWQADGDTLSAEKPVTLTWNNGQGLTFARKIEIDQNYMFTITDTVSNSGDTPVEIAPFGRVVHYGTPPNASRSYVLHEGPIGVFDGSLDDKNKYSDVKSDGEKGEKLTYTSTGGWMGNSDKYWLVAQIPPSDEHLAATISYEPKGDFYQIEFVADKRPVPAGGSITRQQHLFAGAKVLDMLSDYRDNLGIAHFDRAIDFGTYFWFISKPLFIVMDAIYGVVGNFGISIMCLTILVKAFMFPLANNSYRSMSKMKLLTPKMKELREKFGDDKAKLNQEMMQLYKREKVNPAAGCLPIVVQIPVFYSLYKVIYVTIEMRHAPFFGWIKDLSAPDPTSILNLFGIIPWDYHALFALPVAGSLFHLLSIGVWPLIMGFSMWMQMRLNPTPPDPVQAKLFALMPVVFTFMLAPFNAGLVIYWAWNNTLSIAQQRLIMWRMGVKP